MSSSAGLAELEALSAAELAARLSGHWDGRAALLRQAAEAGLPEGQAAWGQMLLDGREVPADLAAGFLWFCRAAGQEHLDAINMVGRCFDQGWGVAVDKVAAARWFKAASGRGLVWGMYNFATALALGQGVTKDRRAALALFRRAARLGNAKAENFIGSFYEDGWEVTRDLTQAARRYAMAADAGDFRGQFNHARMLIAAGELDEALDWLAKAARTGTARFNDQVTEWLRIRPEPTLRAATSLFAPR